MVISTHKIVAARLAPTLAFIFSSFSFAVAQEGSAPALPAFIVQSIHQDSQRFTQTIVQRIYTLSREGVVSQELLDQKNAVDLAGLRSAYLADFVKYDIDADLDLDSNDFAILSHFLTSRNLANLRIRSLNSDINEDGIVSFDEMLSAASKDAEASAIERQGRPNNFNLMLFDENADGNVTVGEVLKIISVVNNQPDADPIRLDDTSRASPPNSPQQPSCDIPVASEESDVFVLTGHQGAALPTISVAGQDEETTLNYLYIEDGDTPIYLIVTAFTPAIWKVEGNVNRLEHLVVEPPLNNRFIGSGAGVIGVPEDRVTFSDPLTCIGRYDIMRNAESWPRQKALLSSIIEHRIDASIEIHSLSDVRIPSGQFTELPRIRARTATLLAEEDISPQVLRFPNAEVRHSMLRFYPGGLVHVDQDTILSNGALTPYSVYPSAAGLSQLIGQGLIRLEGNKFFIQEAIPRFPANLAGSHAVQFILGSNVPVPEGPIGHSSLVREETGECLLGYMCR